MLVASLRDPNGATVGLHQPPHAGGSYIRVNPSEQIDKLIAETTDWRGKTLASVRKALLVADPEIIEEWK